MLFVTARTWVLGLSLATVACTTSAASATTVLTAAAIELRAFRTSGTIFSNVSDSIMSQSGITGTPDFRTEGTTRALANIGLTSSSGGTFAFSGSGLIEQLGDTYDSSNTRHYSQAIVDYIYVRFQFEVPDTSTVTLSVPRFDMSAANPHPEGNYPYPLVGFESRIHRPTDPFWGNNAFFVARRSIIANGTNAFGGTATLSAGEYEFGFLVNLHEPYAIPNLVTGDFDFSVSFSDATEAPGFSQSNPLIPPLLPGVPPGTFTDVPSGRWYDPPLVDGYDFEMTNGSLFTDILGFPIGFDGSFTVSVGDIVLGEFVAGDAVNFAELLGGSGVASFRISGIDPLVDAADPSAFPIQLAFNTPTADFTMTPVPEPVSLSLMALGGIALLRRRVPRRPE